MSIRKFGTEPARVETRVEDNDPETLSVVKERARDDSKGHTEPERDDDNSGQSL